MDLGLNLLEKARENHKQDSQTKLGNFCEPVGEFWDPCKKIHRSKRRIAHSTIPDEPSENAIFILSLEGVIRSWNKGAERIFNAESSDMIQRPFSNLVPSEYRPLIYDRLKEIQSSHSVEGFEIPRISKNGLSGKIWLSMKLLINKEGKPWAIAVTAKGITPQKKETMKLKLNQKIINLIGSGMGDDCVLYTIDLEGKILTWSKEAERINGFLAKDVVGWNYSIFYPDEELKKGAPQKELKMAAQLGGWEIEGWRVRKDGAPFWANVITTPTHDEKGDIMGFTQAVRDMTASKKTREALSKSRSQFRILMENSLDLVFVLDRVGIISFISRSVETALGYSPQMCLGKYAINYIHTGDIRAAINKIVNVVHGREEADIFKLRLKAKNGNWRIMECKVLNLLKNPNVSGIVISARDVTMIKKLEDRILKVSEEERQRMAGNLHDGLAQELAGIDLLVQALKHSMEEKDYPEFSQANKIGIYLNRAVAKTRDLSHQLYPVNLKDGLIHALKGMADNFQRLFSVTCHFEIEGEFLMTQNIGNNQIEAHCYYIVQEAVKNAIKHGKANQISIVLTCKDNRLSIRVEDNGIGFPHSSHPSDGIGQRVMLHRARMINGTLNLRRNVSGGATVIFSFPISQINNLGESLCLSKQK